MSDSALPPRDTIDPTPTDWAGAAMQRRIRKRYAAERRFRLIGLGAVLLSAGFLTFLLVNISVIRLRLIAPDVKRPFRIPGHVRNIPVASVMAIALILVLIGYIIYGLMKNNGLS